MAPILVTFSARYLWDSTLGSDLKDQLLESLHYGSLQIGAVYRIRTGGFLLDRQALSPLS